MKTIARLSTGWSLPVAVVFSLILTCLFTWPLALHPGRSLPGSVDGGTADVYGYWSTWSLVSAWQQKKDIISCEAIFHPIGAPIDLRQANIPLLALMSLIHRYTGIGRLAIYNLSLLLLPFLAALGASLLAMESGLAPLFSLVAGIACAGAPSLRVRLVSNLQMTACVLLPWILFVLLRCLRLRSRAWPLMLGGLLAITAAASWSHMTLTLWILPMFFLLISLAAPPCGRLRLLLRLATATVLFFLLVLPILFRTLPLLVECHQLLDIKPPGEQGIDFCSFLKPPYGHLLAAKIAPADDEILAAERIRTVLNPGYLILFSACIGLFNRRLKWRRLWIPLLFTFSLLALGSTIRVGGIQVLQSPLLPYNWLSGVWPATKLAPDPLVFADGIHVILYLLAASGFSVLAAGRRTRWRTGLLALLPVILVLELLTVGFPMIPSRILVRTPLLETIRATDLPTAVLHLPIDRNPAALYFQLLHGQPVVNGSPVHAPPASHSYLDNISFEVEDLARERIRFVLVHRNLLDPKVYSTIMSFYRNRCWLLSEDEAGYALFRTDRPAM